VLPPGVLQIVVPGPVLVQFGWATAIGAAANARPAGKQQGDPAALHQPQPPRLMEMPPYGQPNHG
jgi:hypothetical protein